MLPRAWKNEIYDKEQNSTRPKYSKFNISTLQKSLPRATFQEASFLR